MERLERALALFLVVAWRIARLMRLGHTLPDLDAGLLLAPEQWQATDILAKKHALGLFKVLGSVWIRQRLDARAADLGELTDKLSLRLIERAGAPIAALRASSAWTSRPSS